MWFEVVKRTEQKKRVCHDGFFFLNHLFTGNLVSTVLFTQDCWISYVQDVKLRGKGVYSF